MADSVSSDIEGVGSAGEWKCQNSKIEGAGRIEGARGVGEESALRDKLNRREPDWSCQEIQFIL